MEAEVAVKTKRRSKVMIVMLRMGAGARKRRRMAKIRKTKRMAARVRKRRGKMMMMLVREKSKILAGQRKTPKTRRAKKLPNPKEKMQKRVQWLKEEQANLPRKGLKLVCLHLSLRMKILNNKTMQ